MPRSLLFFTFIILSKISFAQDSDSLYIVEQRKDIADYSEQFFNRGELMKKIAKNNIVVMMSLEPTNDFGKLYRLYVSVYNNTANSLDVLDRDISIESNSKGKTETCKVFSLNDYKKRVKSRGLTYEILVGDLDDIVYGRNPDIQRSISTRNRDNRGGGDDTLYMSRSKTFRNETTSTTRISYNQANRYMLRQVADNSEWANGIKGIMSDNYFRSNTLTPQNRFTSGYMAFKRKEYDKISVTIDVGGTKIIFTWNEEELNLL